MALVETDIGVYRESLVHVLRRRQHAHDCPQLPITADNSEAVLSNSATWLAEKAPGKVILDLKGAFLIPPILPAKLGYSLPMSLKITTAASPLVT